jgi:hypothetical protein
MTAHADQETIDRAKLTEPLGYILKPITDGDLRSVVQISLYRQQMERRIRSSEAWLATTLRSVGDGIIATNTAGEIVFMNPVAQKMTGWTAAQAQERLLMDVLVLLDEFTGEPAENPISDLFAGECRSYRLASRSGADTLVEVQCFENRPGPDDLLGAIAVFRDISDRREMEGRLVQSQRMEAVANMAGGLAHDFNNQLMVILGYADELCRETDGEHKQAALAIKQAASLAGSITGQLLTLSRRGTVRFEVLNLNDVICEVQPMISHSLGKSRRLLTDLGAQDGVIRGDRNQLTQVLLNLTINARDAMPGPGELRLESTTIEIERESREALLYRPGRYVRLRVSDTGEGMDKATLARIFEPFFTTKKIGFGTGLGLSVAHSLIVQSGGYISAESEIGRGTSFEILLPCVASSRKVGADSGSNRLTGEDAAPTVLLVDDDGAVRRLMLKFLEREGYQLLEAGDGPEAELVAEFYPEPIHVLVSDVMMPGMSGLELAARLKPLRPDMKTLFVSGYQHDILEQHGLSTDDVNLLPKPFRAAELLQRVQTLMEQGTQKSLR